MTDQRKVALFGELLKHTFPGDHVYEAEDFGHDSWVYRIMAGASSSQRHRVRVTSEFLDDNDEATIRRKFDEWGLADVIRRAGNRPLLITNTGVQGIGSQP